MNRTDGSCLAQGPVAPSRLFEETDVLTLHLLGDETWGVSRPLGALVFTSYLGIPLPVSEDKTCRNFAQFGFQTN